MKAIENETIVDMIFKLADETLLEYQKKRLVILLVNSMLNDYSSMLKDEI